MFRLQLIDDVHPTHLLQQCFFEFSLTFKCLKVEWLLANMWTVLCKVSREVALSEIVLVNDPQNVDFRTAHINYKCKLTILTHIIDNYLDIAM